MQTLRKIFRPVTRNTLIFYLALPCLPIQLFQCIYHLGKFYCFLFLRAKFRNRAILFDETHIELLDTDLGFLKDIMLDSLKCFVSTQILESVCVPGHNIKGMSKVN